MSVLCDRQQSKEIRISMDNRKKAEAEVIRIVSLTDGIFSMWLREEQMASTAVPGQFASFYSKDGSRLLPRPISICECKPEEGLVRFVFRVAGKGTEEFSHLTAGDKVEVLGPLGNGYRLEGENVLLFGGGIGIPPMLFLAGKLHEQGIRVQTVLGYRGGDLFLKEEFEPYGTVYVATEDGSAGVRGNVIDAAVQAGLGADCIYACGPTPMLKGIRDYARNKEIPAQISLEEKMACGIGACLACVCQSKEKDEHSNVNNKRICKDGPVFYADEIIL